MVDLRTKDTSLYCISIVCIVWGGSKDPGTNLYPKLSWILYRKALKCKPLAETRDYVCFAPIIMHEQVGN